ncbi:YebB family permuted papain-like enzyme [Solimicrobium silvestre]|uniref:Permuted papain-like amidase enzyme, YaeF/YiiX, C92 family n=1 Tax=Solimicrobium silvestre TaxID=2099400 RepID=A0A2S9H251_9BURK|nr:YebB family permuted papain-like enzyme [Solimicrobium silvestre]PRC94065.1 Orthopoxvirus protein of unknown function (DUF830) [Solimicrobium silvestre]
MFINTNSFHQSKFNPIYAFTLIAAVLFYPLHANAVQLPDVQNPTSQSTSIDQIAKTLKVGDLIFIRVSARPFREVADATGTWTNHVGIVTDIDGSEPLIGESTFPFSRTTTLTKFVARSEQGHVAVTRLKSDLSPQQIQMIQRGVKERSGIFYDTGFNLHSHKEFCSRFVYEVVKDATGVSIGKIETFKEMLASRPDINLGFWKVWYFGQIPWERETITPASLLNSPELNPIFNGNVDTTNHLS